MKTTNILLITFLLCNICHAQFACDPRLKTDLADLYFDGPVNKMVVEDHYLYVGGSFNNVGHYTGAFVNINKITGYEQTRLAAVGARPYSFASGVPDSMGNLVVVGNYNKAGDSARSNISIINATTGKVTPLNIITDSIVNCAVVANGILYIGGYFNNVNGVPRSKIAAISMTTGALTSWSPGITNTGRPLPCRIETMVLNGTTLYVGGAFSNIGNTARNNIGAIDINTGSATSFAPDAYYSTAPTYGNVSKMLKIGNLLYICGGFDYVGGKIHGDVAAIDLSTGISTNWTPNPNSVVLGMNYKGDTLYLAGAFYKIDGQPRKSFAAYSIRTGNLLPIAIDTRIPVLEHIYDIAIANDTLYLAGSFDTIGNVARKNIAAFSRLDGTPFPFQSNINGEPRSLLHYYNRLYVGGYFTSGGMKARKNIAALDLDADTVIPWCPKINGNVSKIVPADGKVYISGDFTKVNDSTRHFNASVDGITGRTTSWDPQADTAFEDIAKYKGNIYMAGSFDSIRRNAINGLCKLDSNGVPQGWWCKPNGVVQHIAILHDSLYFSGLFSDVSGMARTGIASINLVGDSLNPWPIASDTIYNMRLIGDNLYVVIKTKVSKNNNYYFGHTIIQYFLYERQQNIRSIFPIVIQDHPATMGIIKDFVASNVRMYTVGIFDTVVHYPLGIQTFSSHKGVAFLNLSPDPQPNPPDFTIRLNDFESNIQNRTSVDAIAIYGNKLYIGGDFYDWAGGYRYAQEYYLPYNIPEGNLSTDTNGVCSGQKATVRLHSSVTLGADYHWYVNGTAISNTLPYYTFVPANKDSISCVITAAANGCMHDGWDTTNAIVYDVTPTVTPDISISGPAAEEASKKVVVKATVKDAATGYTIEWFNKGVSMGKTTVDSIVYTKGTGTDSIYAVITPRTDTCYVTDTSSLITIDEIPLGISSLTGDESIKVYPNPFDTYVRITGLEQGDMIQVYDVTGRRVWSKVSTDKEYLLPTKEMHTGVYVLNVTDRSGIPQKHLLIEKR